MVFILGFYIYYFLYYLFLVDRFKYKYWSVFVNQGNTGITMFAKDILAGVLLLW